jgi:hypothetical protein
MVTRAPLAAGDATGQVAVAMQVARQLAGAAGADAALVGGGIAAGLGNAASDIDIYLVTSAGAAAPARRQLALGPHRVDVRELPMDQVKALTERVAQASMADEESARPLSPADLALAVRLTGAVAAAGGELIKPVLAAVDRRRLRALAIGHWLSAALTAAEDLAGMDEQRDGEAAVLCARTALLAAGKAVCAACGDLHDGGKWVFRQLARSAPDGFPRQRFAELSRCDPLAPGQPSLADIGALTQASMLAAATTGWQQVPAAGWPALAWPGEGPLRREPGWYPLAFDRCVLAVGPAGRRLRMRHDVALVWALCGGSSAAAVTAEAGRLRAMAPGYAELTAGRCAALISRLAGAGLVRQA